MQPVGTALFDALHFFAQLRKISGEQRGRDNTVEHGSGAGQGTGDLVETVAAVYSTSDAPVAFRN